MVMPSEKTEQDSNFYLLSKVEKMREQSKNRRIEKQVLEETCDLCEEQERNGCQSTHNPDSVLHEEKPGFSPPYFEVSAKDIRSIMDVAVFRLSKKYTRVNEVIRYELPNGHVTVSSGSFGMASVWDYDLVLMAISHLTDATNRYQKGDGEIPSRVIRLSASSIIKFCRRSDGGSQKEDLVDALIRLNTTHVAVERTRKNRNGRMITESEGETLISRYKVITNESTGKPKIVEIELPNWLYKEVVENQTPEVLTVHSDFFLITTGIGRFVYRMARLAAGKNTAK